MKRSEVVKQITELIDGLMINERHIAENQAELILAQLEAIGVAPPEVAEYVETHYRDAMGHVFRGEDSKLYVRKWEVE
jgi:hypothetical protein